MIKLSKRQSRQSFITEQNIMYSSFIDMENLKLCLMFENIYLNIKYKNFNISNVFLHNIR